MRHGSLFSGIGGFDLAAQWMGWENVMQCEIDPFCQSVLRHHFPSSHLYGDIRDIDGTQWTGKIDILTGGFPCQPFSAAGQRRGTADDRFLWPEMLRVIREIQPTWIVAENVRGLLTLDDGMVFESVRTDLEEHGYECQPLLIPACSVGAPHRRDRVWFIAHRHDAGDGRVAGIGTAEGGTRQSQGPQLRTEHDDQIGNKTPNAPCDTYNQHIGGRTCWGEPWLQAATRLCRVDDGLPRELDGITVPRWRKESLKAYGNAIVPQVAHRIFRAVEEAEMSSRCV